MLQSVWFTIAIFPRPPGCPTEHDSWRYVPTTAAAFFDTENNICTAHGNHHASGRIIRATHAQRKPVQPDSVAAKSLLVFASLSLKATYFDFNRNKHPKTRKLSGLGEKTSLFLLPHVFYISFWPHVGKTTKDSDHHFLSLRRFDHRTLVGIQLPLRVRREENLKSTTWLGAVQDELS